MYILHDIDDDAYPYYYGYLSKDGDWYIMRQDSNGTIRFHVQSVRGKGKYSESWNERTVLPYITMEGW